MTVPDPASEFDLLVGDADKFGVPFTKPTVVERARAFGFGVSTASVERGAYHNTILGDDSRWNLRHHLATP